MTDRAPRRGRPPAFDRAALLDATVSVIERHGLAATTLKDVAAELDVTAMALYRFCESKDDLLDQVPDFLARSIAPAIDTAGDGLDTLRATADALGAVLDAHPNCAPLFHRPSVGPNMADLADTVVGRLHASGFEPRRAAGILRATMALVVGLRVTGGSSAEASLGPIADDALSIWLAGVAGELPD